MKKLWQFVTRHWVWVAVLAAVAAMGIALWIGASQSVWFDEAYSVRLARSSWDGLFSLTAVDAHPPLYYALLKIWGEIGGFGGIWLRAFSAVCLGGTVFLSLVLARKCFGRRAAIIAAPILLLAPFMLRYGFEIRMYSLAGLIAVASTLVLTKLVECHIQSRDSKGVVQSEKIQRKFSPRETLSSDENGMKTRRKTWVFYGILVAAGMLTLNYMAFVFVAQLVWLIAQYRRNRKKSDKIWKQDWFKAFVLAVILYLPWTPFAVGQLLNSASAGIATPLGTSELIKILSFSLVYAPDFWLDKFASATVIIATILIVCLTVKAWRADENHRPALQLLLIILLIPFAIMMLLGLVSSEGFFVERYMAHFIWAGYLLIGVVLAINFSHAKILKQRIIAAVVYLFVIATLVFGVANLVRYGNFNFQRMQNNVAQEIIEKIGGCQADQAIVVDDVYEYIEISHYLPDCGNLYFYSPWAIDFRGGYAPVADSSQRLIGQEINTPNLVVIRIKGKKDFQLPAGYELTKTIEKYDVVNIEFYERK